MSNVLLWFYSGRAASHQSLNLLILHWQPNVHRSWKQNIWGANRNIHDTTVMKIGFYRTFQQFGEKVSLWDRLHFRNPSSGSSFVLGYRAIIQWPRFWILSPLQTQTKQDSNRFTYQWELYKHHETWGSYCNFVLPPATRSLRELRSQAMSFFFSALASTLLFVEPWSGAFRCLREISNKNCDAAKILSYHS